MDDITTLEQMTDAVDGERAHLFKPRDQYRLATGGGFGGGGGGGGGAPAQVTPENAPVHPTGQNPPTGVVVQYWLKRGERRRSRSTSSTPPARSIRSYTSKADSAAQPAAAAPRTDSSDRRRAPRVAEQARA